MEYTVEECCTEVFLCRIVVVGVVTDLVIVSSVNTHND
jgi:hypothetical protein